MTRSGRTPTQRLIFLTRYPSPGAVKTRLAAALGDERAAELHGAIALHCLRHLIALSATREARLEIRHDGGAAREVHEWLDPAIGRDSRIALRAQPQGDLGQRLHGCFADAFAEGAHRVAAVGADCPALDAAFARRALARLDDADVVFAPAEDGGYALVGVRREAAERALPALFAGVPWGTGDVLRVSLERARRAGVAVAATATLADIDRPEDLGIWERVLAEEARVRAAPRLSVVIPTLDEQHIVERAVSEALSAGADEVVVADGHSRDATRERAGEAGAIVVESAERGRAWQMNRGAAAATSDALVFVHADTRLPSGFVGHVHDTLATPGVVAGAFEFGVDDPRGARDWIIDRVGRTRCRMRDFPYGDQAPFVRASTFHELGGFPEIPTMEDYELARRLKRLGRIARVPRIAPTSARSWHEHGLVRATAVNVAVILGYDLGVAPERLARWRGAIASRGEESEQATT